jgi:hypothetical protein
MRRVLCLGMISFVILSVVLIAAAQMYYPYCLRGGGTYMEGICPVRPISGVDIHLRSARILIEDAALSEPGSMDANLHLAFYAPPDSKQIEVEIQGPGDYLLNDVNREFQPGLNVFVWSAEVVKGLGISPFELEPKVSVVGGMLLPCLLHNELPTSMPNADSCRIVLESNTTGLMTYFLRDSGNLVLNKKRPVTKSQPFEINIPAVSDADHIDLFVLLEFDHNGRTRTWRQCFPIQPLTAATAEIGG